MATLTASASEPVQESGRKKSSFGALRDMAEQEAPVADPLEDDEEEAEEAEEAPAVVPKRRNSTFGELRDMADQEEPGESEPAPKPGRRNSAFGELRDMAEAATRTVCKEELHHVRIRAPESIM